MTPLLASLSLSTQQLGIILAALLGYVAVYVAARVFSRHDYGLPVRRKLMARGIRVERDQVAYVPIWWNDMQISRAVKAHWKTSLRQNFAPPSQGRAKA